MLEEKKPQEEAASKTQTEATSTEQAEPVSNKKKVLNIVGIVLCVILLPILILNCILIVKGLVVKDEVPSLGNTVPLIVLTESMEPDILAGDLIFVKKVDAQSIKVGDVIAFFDPAGNGSSIVTHKVDSLVLDGNGKITHYKTYGINNINADGSFEMDGVPVPVKNLVGLYKGSGVPFIGHVAMFMQSTWGLVICIFIPVAAFIVYEVLRRRKQDAAKQSDIDTLMAELKALKAAQEAAPVQPAQAQPADVQPVATPQEAPAEPASVPESSSDNNNDNN